MRKSINKTTLIIVLAVFLTISVGYALFSDTITIEGTATAQGNFDIEVTCITTIPEELVDALDDFSEGEFRNDDNGYKDESCVVKGDKIIYSVGLEYPRAEKQFMVKIRNVGSIDAQSMLFDGWLFPKEPVVKTYDSVTHELISITSPRESFFDEGWFLFERSNNTFLRGGATEEELQEFVDFDKGIYMLKSGYTYYQVFKVIWPEKHYNEDGVYYEATYTIDIPFEQYTK